MTEPATELPWWLGWVLPVVTLLGVLWAAFRRLFTIAVSVVMEEMHAQNQERFREVFSRLSEIELMLARIEGRQEEEDRRRNGHV